jgi:hypothetical protein
MTARTTEFLLDRLRRQVCGAAVVRAFGTSDERFGSLRQGDADDRTRTFDHGRSHHGRR